MNLTDMIEDKAIPASLESSLHKTIKKVSSDIENMKFNTAIATLMAFINEIYAVGYVTKEVLGAFVSLLSPFAPHISEEIWEMMWRMKWTRNIHCQRVQIFKRNTNGQRVYVSTLMLTLIPKQS